jgi:hypothetical protein
MKTASECHLEEMKKVRSAGDCRDAAELQRLAAIHRKQTNASMRSGLIGAGAAATGAAATVAAVIAALAGIAAIFG